MLSKKLIVTLAMLASAWSRGGATTCGTGTGSYVSGTAVPIVVVAVADGSGYYAELKFPNANPANCVEDVWFTDKSTESLMLTAVSMSKSVYVVYTAAVTANTFYDKTINYKLMQANLLGN